MKFTLTIDSHCSESEVCVRASALDDRVRAIEAIARSDQLSTIAGYQAEKIRIIDLNDASRFFTRDKKVYVSTNEGIWLVHQRMFELEEMLPSSLFVRISQSDIVNIREMKHVEVSFPHSLIVVMKNGVRCPISRRYLNAVKRALGL